MQRNKRIFLLLCVCSVLISWDLFSSTGVIKTAVETYYTRNKDQLFIWKNDSIWSNGQRERDKENGDLVAPHLRDDFDIEDDPNHRESVLLLSSVGRSGSSFLGEVLASQGHNMYFYEPIRLFSDPDHQNRTLVLQELRRYFHCGIRDPFLNTTHDVHVAARHPSTLGKVRGHISPDEVRRHCRQEPLRIIKTIRTRVEWVEELLEDKDLNLKVIHLVRDPRGNAVSMATVDWNTNIEVTCANIRQDLEQRDEMLRKFPTKYFFIKYEEFCLDPYAKTKEILRFLQRDPRRSSETRDPLKEDLPENVREFLDSHTNAMERKGTYSTSRHTWEMFQRWRQTIQQNQLMRVESVCNDVILLLNHTLFGHVSFARNLSISLFRESRHSQSDGIVVRHPNNLTDSKAQTYHKNPRLSVLLLSSVGRSGSSFLGELLASMGHNMYFFEPIRCMPLEDQRREKIIEELKRYFRCELRDGFLKSGAPFKVARHYSTKDKKIGKISEEEVSQYCVREPVRIIKTIRTRLEWTKGLLRDEDLRLKVIHLVRDPRGNAVSMKRVNWETDINSSCSYILQDFDIREEMERNFPDKYFFLKYEDLCLDPYGKTKELLRFLGNDGPSEVKDATLGSSSSPEDLPKSVRDYLDTHIHINAFTKISVWSTARDTSAIFQKWRKKISQEGLKIAETVCEEVIRRLHHRMFGTIDRARNMSLSLFEDPGSLSHGN